LLNTAVVAVDMAVVVAPMAADSEAVGMPAGSAVATRVALQVGTQAALQAATLVALQAPVDSRVEASATLLTLDTRQDFAAAASRPPMRTVM